MTLLLILFFNFIGSIISLLGGIILLLNKNWATKYSHYLASFAAGTLLGTVFFDLLEEAIHESEELGIEPSLVFLYTLLGILGFFILERLLHWFHHHGHEDHVPKGKPIIMLLVIGDTIHNFIDGIAIAATFLVSFPAGIITTLAVGFHEIPQEIGDFGLMIKNGFSRKKALLVNILSAAASFLGVIIAFYFGEKVQGLSIIFLAISAGLFLYIALSDLIPEIHHENKKSLAFKETLWLFAGVASIYIVLYILNDVLKLGH